jgi:hypothetical protein
VLLESSTVDKLVTRVLRQLGPELDAPGDPDTKRRSQWTASTPPGASPNVEVGSVLASNFNELVDSGEFNLAYESFVIPSRARRAREGKAPSRPHARVPDPTQLASGSMLPRMFCFPAMVPPSGLFDTFLNIVIA